VILRHGIIAKDIMDKEKLKDMGYIVFDIRDFAPFSNGVKRLWRMN